MRKILPIALIVCGVVLIDQILKILIRQNMTVGQRIPTGDTFIRLLYLENDGIAFSMLEGNRWFLVVTQLVLITAIIVLMIFVIRKAESKLLLVAFPMMLGGGIGNLIDRIIFGSVTDFISVGSFAVFNFADMSLTIGCGIMLIYLFTSSHFRETEGKEQIETEHVETEQIETEQVVTTQASEDSSES